MRLLLALAALVALPANAVTIDWVFVGDASNAPDTATNCYAASCGSVPYDYYISKYEVTNAQYAEFLNVKAASDPLGLYSANMGFDPTFGGITRSGSSGSYTYAVKAGFADKPVTFVSFYDALRFANWLNNGQGSGDTETGAYTLLGGTATPSNGTTVGRNVGANIFLPSENEWYKAAYYSPAGVYFDFPAGTNSVTACAMPTSTGNRANCNTAVGSVTDVGGYTGSGSPYGTFDQGGNLFEWNEQIVAVSGGSYRSIRGGSWLHAANDLGATAWSYTFPTFGESYFGFRVASVPEPGAGFLLMTGLVRLAISGSRRT